MNNELFPSQEKDFVGKIINFHLELFTLNI